MPAARDLLDRFRPVGIPGSAAPAGVASDRTASVEAELAPVLADVDATLRECERLRAAAHAEAERIGSEATARAAAISEQAHTLAVAERAGAAAQERERADAHGRSELESARQQAELVGERAAAHLPALVERVLELARAELDAGGEP